MKMYSMVEIHRAAIFWYGKNDIDSCCMAENRLMRGEVAE